ncbi:crotonase/enoyl-CoA hydratase family protein [Pseudoalteromonas fenneropenaei]|uniref:Crotonase/enoyl-CoA hydratase family protein n=1 Tax=Pseudoalteromonas fenneropenaei TaxID=1737459 RepID=A0ABV7CH13_9GAMM
MIKFDLIDQIAWVTLSRPEKQNALSYEMFVALKRLTKELKSDRTLRAVVLQGEGAHFCSGLDVKSVVKSPRKVLGLLWKWLPGNRNLVQQVVLGWQSLPVPVFCLLQGNCFGGGMQIALGADFRLATPDTQLAIMEARWGLCPDMGATVHLPAQLNYDQALWLSMSAQPINAEEAFKLGLISEVCTDPHARCLAMLAELTQRSPDALAAIKQVCLAAYHPKTRAILSKETWAQLNLLSAKNTKIAMYNAQHEAPKPFQPRR